MRARASIALLLGAVLGLALASPAQVKPGDNLIVEGIPPISDELVARLTQYQNICSASFADWHPSRRAMLINTRFGETSQLHLVESPGGARRQLTFLRERTLGGDFCPQAEHHCLILRSDVGGGGRKSPDLPPRLGGRLVKHARYYWLLLAEGHLTRQRFGPAQRGE